VLWKNEDSLCQASEVYVAFAFPEEQFLAAFGIRLFGCLCEGKY